MGGLLPRPGGLPRLRRDTYITLFARNSNPMNRTIFRPEISSDPPIFRAGKAKLPYICVTRIPRPIPLRYWRKPYTRRRIFRTRCAAPRPAAAPPGHTPRPDATRRPAPPPAGKGPRFAPVPRRPPSGGNPPAAPLRPTLPAFRPGKARRPRLAPVGPPEGPAPPAGTPVPGRGPVLAQPRPGTPTRPHARRPGPARPRRRPGTGPAPPMCPLGGDRISGAIPKRPRPPLA